MTSLFSLKVLNDLLICRWSTDDGSLKFKATDKLEAT